jgi:hypothetical protein
MRKATWRVTVFENGTSGNCSAFVDDPPRGRARDIPQPGAEAEKALFKCRDVDFVQHMAYLRDLVDRAAFSDRNRKRMLAAIDLFEKSKRTMAAVITDEVGGA